VRLSRGIKKAIERIKPDKIYISVPTRPPAEPWVMPPDPERIIRAHEIIGTALDLTQYESGEFGVFPDARTAILEICSRHPLREEQARVIEKKFSKNAIIDEMLSKNILVRVEYRNISYLLPAGFVRGTHTGD
jgi:wyosine [tRNA(Phe)-imidazoG37] synthetase (radical SAM superfamily)